MFATDRVYLLRPNLQIPAKTLVVWSAIYPVIICLANLLDKQLHCFQFAPTLYVQTFLLHSVTVICREIPTWGLKQISLQAIWFFHYQYFVLSCFSKNDSSETPSKIMTQFFLPPPNSSHLQSAVRVSVCFSL